MATLLIDGVNEYVTSRYIAASEDEKQQIRQVIEDIFRLWTYRSDASVSEQLRQKAIAFGLQHKTFPLDWSHNKLTREELNER